MTTLPSNSHAVPAPGMKATCPFCGLANHMWANIRCRHFERVLVTPQKRKEFLFVPRGADAAQAANSQ